jgi:Rrf2 family protein
MLFSKSCEYAMRAVLYLASREEGGHPVLLREISDALDIPHHFLNKVLQQLTRDGILVSHKGITGGFSVARPSSEITLEDIVKAIDGERFRARCVLGIPGCGDDAPCPVHAQWACARDIILGMIRTRSVHHLSREMQAKTDVMQDEKRA